MKILYISTVFPEAGTSTIYTDLAEALVENGHEVTVVATEDRRKHTEMLIRMERGCRVLRVKAGNMYDVGLIEKGISIVTMPSMIKRAMKKYLGDEKIDLILFEAPPVTMEEIVRYAKIMYGARAFLMMKDIFPQNAVDIGIMKKGSLLYRYFEHKEKRLYQVADAIGCMSMRNLEYLMEKSGVPKEKLSIFPNTKRINNVRVNKKQIREKYHIPSDKVVFVFGGNMGKPQGMVFLARAIVKARRIEDAFFVLVGRGTEREMVKGVLKECSNNLMLSNLPRDEYEALVSSCDVGIISLDYRFTIPNYPSRVLSYMEYAMPILAATDKNTDFKSLIVEDARCGIWCESRDESDFVEAVEKMVCDKEMRCDMGQSGYSYMKRNFSVERSVELLENYCSRK